MDLEGYKWYQHQISTMLRRKSHEAQWQNYKITTGALTVTKIFSNLLNVPSVTSTREMPPAESDLDKKAKNIDHLELIKAIKSLNYCKTPGFDYKITAEAIKYGDDELADKLRNLVNLIKNRQKPLCDWIKNLITALPKKIINYRGI